MDRALCDHAVKLTREPASVAQGDIDRLRELGLTDRAINDATQVISYFIAIMIVGVEEAARVACRTLSGCATALEWIPAL